MDSRADLRAVRARACQLVVVFDADSRLARSCAIARSGAIRAKECGVRLRLRVCVCCTAYRQAITLRRSPMQHATHTRTLNHIHRHSLTHLVLKDKPTNEQHRGVVQ